MTESFLPVFYLGDSHVRYFHKAAKFGLLTPFEVSGVEVGGATAVGMRNPNAKTNALGRFKAWLRDKPLESILVFHLGEVDCGFVIWYRADKYEESIETQMKSSISAYFEFVDELLGLGFVNIIITGATLPTITDDDQVGEVVVKRSSINATQRERTELTVRYNCLLRDEAAQRGLLFVDIAPDVLDPVTGVVDVRLRNSNPEDHHMNGNVASVYWASRLYEAISHYQPSVQNRRVWKCTRSTFLKSYPGHSKSMPADMRQRVEFDSIVTGNEKGTFGEFTVIRDVAIDGDEVPMLHLLHTRHFSVVS